MSMKYMFKKVETQVSFPKMEEATLKYWETENIFEKSVSQRAGKPRYSFNDGPPFATGTPHYGHIVASVIKDAVPRYWTMRGFQVERKWGWDCHGLPIENIAEIQRILPIDSTGIRSRVGEGDAAHRTLGGYAKRLQDHGQGVYGKRLVGVQDALG